MEENKVSQAKIEKPAEPREVLIDPALSKEQKMEALDALEQDARQLSVASAEGMTGGEPTKLHDVLDAKDSLEVPPTGHAYGVVLSDLRSRLKADVTGDTRDMLEKALAALDAVVKLSTPKTAADAPAAGAHGGPKAEIHDEIARERTGSLIGTIRNKKGARQPFVAADMPTATPFMLHCLTVFAGPARLQLA